MKLDLITTLEPSWNTLIQEIRGHLDRLEDCFILVFDNFDYNHDPFYLQAATLNENGMQIEALSAECGGVQLAPQGSEILKDLGWTPPNDASPNHHIWLTSSRPNNDLVARFLALTMRDAYNFNPDGQYSFQ